MESRIYTETTGCQTPWRRVDEYSNRLINTGANGDIFAVAQNKFQVAAYEAEDPF